MWTEKLLSLWTLNFLRLYLGLGGGANSRGAPGPDYCVLDEVFNVTPEKIEFKRHLLRQYIENRKYNRQLFVCEFDLLCPIIVKG